MWHILTDAALFSNVTSTSAFGTAVITDCPVQCTHDVEYLNSLTWSPMTVTATVTVETVLLVVNKKYNSTRTSRITNTEVDLTGYTPAADVDSAGTRTTSIVISTSNTISTHTVIFPTNFFADYPSSYTICGTLPTTLSGVATCIKHSCLNPTSYASTPVYFDSGAPTIAYPSHPPVPQTSTLAHIRDGDFKGLTYVAVWGTIDDFLDIVPGLFPGLGVWNCSRGGNLESPDHTLNAALYLTATSTSIDDSDINTTGLPQATSVSGLPGPISEAGDVAPTTNSKPSVSETATKLPETSPGNLPTSDKAVKTGGDIIKASKQASLNSLGYAPSAASGIVDDVLSSTAEKLPPAAPIATNVPVVALTKASLQATITASVGTSPSSADDQSPAASSLAQLSAVTITLTHGQSSPVATSSSVVNHVSGSEAVPIVLNSHMISTDVNAQYLVSGQPLVPGSTAMVGSGPGATPAAIHISSSQTVLVVGSSSSTLTPTPTFAAAPAMSIGTQILAVNSENHYVIGSQTLAPGVAVTLGSSGALTPVILHTSNSHIVVVVGSSTQTLLGDSSPQTAAAPAILTIGSQILAANSEGGYVVGSQTLAPGSPITLGSGNAATPVALQITSSSTVLIVGSSTSTLIAAVTPIPQPLTIGTEVLSANPQNQYIAGSQTLEPGSPITLGLGTAATPVSLQTSGSQTLLIAGTITSTLAPAATAPPDLTIGNQVVTANAGDQYVVGSQNLTPGGVITVSGTPISLAPSGTQVVVGTSTEGLGGYIVSGLEAGPSGNASGTIPYKGAAGRPFQGLWKSVVLGIGVGFLMVW